MTFLNFLFTAVIISLSGVMAPGPITAVTIGKGSKSSSAGALIAVGHGIVEFPLMLAIFYGLGYLLNLSYIKSAIGLVGGLFLLVMGFGMFRSIAPVEVDLDKENRSPLIDGIALSLGNPYFLIWWATIGATLILSAVNFGMFGFITFALVHWLCDFFWYYFLSVLSFKGGQFFGKKFQKIIFIGCGIILLFFGGKFILSIFT
ncbi:MAG TPA: hypothetical protein DHV62_01630 [Elusimicrobia bacterium]|jgi:threonine/homoserine/homoserine lactone efflux protein|nr:hypothetical protein [Elusimicrobiota bacterium]